MGGLTTEVAFLSRALKMPRIRQVAPDMANSRSLWRDAR